jgi:hypothetical protein
MDQHHGGTAALVAESEPTAGMFCEAVQFSLLVGAYSNTPILISVASTTSSLGLASCGMV